MVQTAYLVLGNVDVTYTVRLVLVVRLIVNVWSTVTVRLIVNV